MRLTKFTDYALRVLIYSGSTPQDRATIDEVAAQFHISVAHVKKVVLHLSRAGFLKGIRGRSGGFELARAPDQINIGAVIRSTEPDFALFECFLQGNACHITRPCHLPSIGHEALAGFIAAFDKYTLADVLVRPAYFTLASDGRSQPQRAWKPARA